MPATIAGTFFFAIDHAAFASEARTAHETFPESRSWYRWARHKNLADLLDGTRILCIIALVQVSPVQGHLEHAVRIQISPRDGLPIYLQIVNQVTYLVAAGRLNPGEELPPIRVLAQQLLVNPNTVARAYRELETAGVVTKRRTSGTYVSEAGSPLARRERMKILAQRADVLLAESRQMDVDLDELVELLRQRDELMHPRGKSHPQPAVRRKS